MGDLIPTQHSLIETLLTGQLSESTISAYKHDLEQFFGIKNLHLLSKDQIQAVTIQDIISFRNEMLSRYKPITVGRKLSTLRTAFSYFVDLGLITTNPAKSKLVRSPRISTESPTNSLSRQEAENLLRQPDRKTLVGKRNYAILQLLLHNGPRRSEVVGLRLKDLSTEGVYQVLKITGKGGKVRMLKLKPQVIGAIKEYLSARQEVLNPDDYIFSSHSHGKVLWQKQEKRLTGEAIRQMIQSCCQKAGIDKPVSPHSLRHTFTTLAIDGGAKVQQAQAALGHSDLKTTMRYFKNRENLADNATDYVHLGE